ncbi:MAG: hypothetical protein QOG21_27 [Actinomycetota bacterium]|nr:hypothetical protein [Actinomycetota bacterium]
MTNVVDLIAGPDLSSRFLIHHPQDGVTATCNFGRGLGGVV